MAAHIRIERQPLGWLFNLRGFKVPLDGKKAGYVALGESTTRAGGTRCQIGFQLISGGQRRPALSHRPNSGSVIFHPDAVPASETMIASSAMLSAVSPVVPLRVSPNLACASLDPKRVWPSEIRAAIRCCVRVKPRHAS